VRGVNFFNEGSVGVDGSDPSSLCGSDSGRSGGLGGGGASRCGIAEGLGGGVVFVSENVFGSGSVGFIVLCLDNIVQPGRFFVSPIFL